MKKFGSKAGFTLVELIVVIAILGILAGVAVPAYSGYIKKANEATDMSQLDAIKTAAVFAAVEANIPKDTNVTAIYVTNAGAVTYDATVAGENKTAQSVNITPYFNTTGFSFKSDKFSTSGAKWTTAGGWVANSGT